MLVEDTFTIPVKATLGKYTVRSLGPSDVEPDLKAVNENIELIRRTRGGAWPKQAISLEDDLKDLKEHERLFGVREAFAYCIIRNSDGAYAGCFYIYPPNHPLDDTDKSDMPLNADAVVSFWVTAEAYRDGLYAELFPFAESWLRSSWPFRDAFIANKEKPATP